MTSLTIENGNLVILTQYDPGLVQAIKSIPASERKYDPARKAWLVDPKYGQKVAGWIAQYLGEMVLAPQAIPAKPVIELKTLELHYIGSCKERAPGEFTAFGWDGKQWSAILPETVLRTWFEGKPAQTTGHTNANTLYGILGITQQTTQDDLKAAYRRMVRMWHPDVCKEQDAKERFIRIQEAYEILNNPNKRARYDAGLTLEASINKVDYPATYTNNYRAPLLCGLILAEGVYKLGRFVVDKIILWEDVTNSQGQTLVSSWPMGATQPFEMWL